VVKNGAGGDGSLISAGGTLPESGTDLPSFLMATTRTAKTIWPA
jgi:hypothetical protein